uniref:C2H2-type domain-containing protein n=1 Tax=Panagrolaimus sp. ES5 TaxID=591445 RepID=A0AC34FWX8_9BILA
MLRKIKKEAASPPVVTIDSDSGSDNEFVQVFKDNVSTDVSLENNRIMIADLIALFPNFHGIQLVGNSMNRFYSKTKFAKKGYFIAPPAGWESVKIIIVVLPTTAESLNSTPRSTPILNEAADNIEPMDCENPKLVKQQDITVPPNVTPIQISDDDIFHRFNVTNLVQLYALPQFLNHSGFALQHFLVYRDNFIKFFRGTLMALGPESFHLSTVFSLNNRICDFTRLLNSLEMSKRIECKICEILFTEPQSAFQHYCSISHGEKHLAARNSEATEVRDILKLAKENMMFPPPLHPRPLMSQMVRPPTLIHANPPMNIQRQSRWDVRPAFASIIPPPVLPQLVQMQRVEPYLSNVPGFCATALPRRNFASGPTPQPLLLERQTNGENDVVTNENEDAQAPSSSVTVSRVKREKRKPPTPPVLHESNSEN